MAGAGVTPQGETPFLHVNICKINRTLHAQDPATTAEYCYILAAHIFSVQRRQSHGQSTASQ